MPPKIYVNPGDRFGRLTIVCEVEKRAGKRYFLCKCDCGAERIVRFVSLRAGEIKSCGCLRNEQNKKANLKHGSWGSRLYFIWHGMKQRCMNPNSPVFKHYGGRGIRVCDEWMIFENFEAWALKNGYSDNLTLDRIDVNGDYCPSNCRWIPQKDQLNNTRRSLIIKYQGKEMNLKRWAEHLGMDYKLLQHRIKRGWSPEKAFNTPLQHQYSRRELS